MAIITSRRSLITGLVSLVAAPAIVRAANIMPVRAIALPDPPLFAQAFYNAMRNAQLDLWLYGACYFEQRGDKITEWRHIPIEAVRLNAPRSSGARPSPS